jgi:hypothetical protein
MTNVFTGEISGIDLEHHISEELSPYDAAYPVRLLSNSLKLRLAQGQVAAKEVYRAVAKEAPMLAQIQQSLKKGSRYVVDASENTLKALDNGEISFSIEKSGKMFAQIREANGQYGSKLPIKKELFRKGLDPIQMANSLQMMALQEQLQEIAEQLNIIDQRVRDVLQGQQNDRIGLYYSGLALYLESRGVTNNEINNALISQSLRSLSEATCQLTLTMQSDINYLKNEEYKSIKGKSVNFIDSHMSNINQSFVFIHQATMLRAGIYCELGELAAMSTVLQTYSNFIEDTVGNNASLLAQCDSNDDGTEEGIWKSRKKLKLEVSNFTKQLNMPDKTIYLGIIKENEQ